MNNFINTTGYLNNSPNKYNPFNIIPSNNITMDNVNMALLLRPNKGKSRIAMPNSGNHNFPKADFVIETPLLQGGGNYFDKTGQHFDISSMQNNGSNPIEDSLKPKTKIPWNAFAIPSLKLLNVGLGVFGAYANSIEENRQKQWMQNQMNNPLFNGSYSNTQNDYGVNPYEQTGQLRQTLESGGNWIQGAINPAHKGFCTPMTKATCTPRRKAFAMRAKNHFKQQGGLWNTNKNQYVDSILNTNQNLNFVQRYQHPNNYPVINNSDGSFSTHLMASSDNFSYPTIIQDSLGKLIKMNPKDAYKYALKNKQYIKFPTEEQANWFSNNGYKKGKQFQRGGKFNPIEYLYGDDEDTDNIPKQTATKAKAKRITDEDIDNSSDEQLAFDILNMDFSQRGNSRDSALIGPKHGGSKNNFGNIMTQSGQYRNFNTPEEGRTALINQLDLYQSGKTKTGVNGNHTLTQAMHIYASDAPNYADFIAKKLGISKDTKIKDIDKNKWADAITQFEGNTNIDTKQYEQGGLFEIDFNTMKELQRKGIKFKLL